MPKDQRGVCPKCGYKPFEPYAFDVKLNGYLRRCYRCGFKEELS